MLQQLPHERVQVRCPDRRLDNSRTVLSRGRGALSAERWFWAGPLWDRGGEGGPYRKRSKRVVGEVWTARTSCRNRLAVAAGAMTHPGLGAG